MVQDIQRDVIKVRALYFAKTRKSLGRDGPATLWIFNDANVYVVRARRDLQAIRQEITLEEI